MTQDFYRGDIFFIAHSPVSGSEQGGYRPGVIVSNDLANRYSPNVEVPAVIRKVAQNHIFDENQSVKWNRDKVAENNAAYQAEVARLNSAKNKARDAIHEDIYRAIQSEVGHGLTRDGARKLWEYAYDKGHAHGSYAIISYLEDLLVLVYEVLDDVKR